MTKMTKRDYFAKLKAMDAVKADAELVAFIDHEIELLAKKNAAKKTLTATQKANIAVKDAIVNALDADKAYAVADVIALVDADMTNQKMTALLTQLVKENKVVRTVDKRKAYFTLV